MGCAEMLCSAVLRNISIEMAAAILEISAALDKSKYFASCILDDYLPFLLYRLSTWLVGEVLRASMPVGCNAQGACVSSTNVTSALQRRQALMGASGPRALIKNSKVFSIALFACLGGVLYGYNQGMFSGILAMPSFGAQTDGYIDNASQKGWLTAILELGAWFGALFSGFVAEVLSRKYGILLATSVFIIGVVVQTTAIVGGHNEILAGRFITLVLVPTCGG
jgi:hypothetical protein